MELIRKKITDLIPDTQNANKGTERGTGLLEESISTLGMGRSILIDREGRIIAGNKTFEVAGQHGLENVIVVQTKGDEIVAVQRTDLDLELDDRARELAYADNRISQVDLVWDDAQIVKDLDAGIDLGKFWFDDELEKFRLDPGFLPVKTSDSIPSPVEFPPDSSKGSAGEEKPSKSREEKEEKETCESPEGVLVSIGNFSCRTDGVSLSYDEIKRSVSVANSLPEDVKENLATDIAMLFLEKLREFQSGIDGSLVSSVLKPTGCEKEAEEIFKELDM